MTTRHKINLDDPTSRLAVTLTADRIFGKVLTLAECADILREYHIDAVVSILAFLKHLNEHVYLDEDKRPPRAEDPKPFEALVLKATAESIEGAKMLFGG